MSEIEIKLQIPKQKKAALLKAITTLTPKHINLHAQYFDTADFSLAKNHTALRLRKEDQTWIQTLKAAGKDALQRYELEVNRGVSETAPSLTFKPYNKDKQAKILLGQLIEDKTALNMQFETVVQRKFKQLQHEGSEIELCLDFGHVGNEQQQEPISEIEFELKSGSTTDLIEFTQQWVQKYNIWLDVRSKAERGNLIARGLNVSPTEKIAHLKLSKKEQKKPIIAQLIRHYLKSLLPCLAAIADQVAERSHYQCAEQAFSHLITILNISQQQELTIAQDQIDTLKMTQQQITDFLMLSQLQEQTQDYYTIYAFKGLNLALNRLKNNISQYVIQPQSTIALLELLKLSYNEKETLTLKISQFKQQLEQQYQAYIAFHTSPDADQKTPTHYDIELYIHYLELETDSLSKCQDEFVQLQHIQHTQQIITELKILKTEQFFLIGWLNAQENHQQQRYNKRLSKINL